MNLKTRDFTLIALFAALTAIGAFINIPIPYVPFTLQYFFCALGSILLGSKKGMLSQLLYVGIGLVGIPVFTKGGGPQYIFQPTFGYLIGFIIGAYVIGKISESVKKLNTKTVIISTLVGLSIIYLFGVSYLYIIQNFYLGATMSLSSAIYSGMILFLCSDIILSIIISITAPQIVYILRKSGVVESFNQTR